MQGMLDPFTPFGMDVFAALVSSVARRLGKNYTLVTQPYIREAGERIYIDLTGLLRNFTGRRFLRFFLAVIEPGTALAVESLLDDPRLTPHKGRVHPLTFLRLIRYFIAPGLFNIFFMLAAPDAGKRRIIRLSGNVIRQVESDSARVTTLAQLAALIEKVYDRTPPILLPLLIPAVAAGQAAQQALRRLSASVPGGSQMVLEMTRGAPNNVTTEMDLSLWEAAQTIIADPDSCKVFTEEDSRALTRLYQQGTLPPAAQTAVASFLQRYGRRGLAEIDLGRPRWKENPEHILQVLRSYLSIPQQSAPDVVFERGAASAALAQARLEFAVRQQPGGWLKRRWVRFFSSRMRSLVGLREMPKFLLMRTWGPLRDAALAVGKDLADSASLARGDDIFFLHLPELKQMAAGEPGDWLGKVSARREAYTRELRRRQVPRLLLSDGTAFYAGVGSPSTTGDVPAANMIFGSPVSPGSVEGPVHVVLDPKGAQLAPGEILVCPGTDPAWTPLFLSAGGLVTEVGGLMTHGSVVAREYGIPAVVGVGQATTRLKTGQRIRLDGTNGQIVIL